MSRLSKFFQLKNGSRIEYTLVGSGKPILLFHGGHSDCHEELGYSNLLEQGYSILTPSRAGYGKTSKELGLSLDSACEAYYQLLNALQISKVHVIAVSAGGPTGITFAAKYPTRVSSLILQSAVAQKWHDQNDTTYKAARILFHPSREKYTWRLLSYLSGRVPKVVVKQMLPSFSKLPADEIMLQWNEDDIDQFSAMIQRQRSHHGFMFDLRQTASSLVPEMKSILCPTLIMHSKYDNAVLPEHAYAAQYHISGSQLCLLESWGHLIWLGRGADSVHKKLNSFLTAVDS
ncbi:alpha/beta hydrolase [Paenibacillus sp. DMB5]|uniref:alpha/beta fold hydrolase n=1 Tax=Paenibacillus sp. DMB5 TaxID=1780103 RepID=UPI00076D8BAD|nr:alpha/beta hydrolase [Paenibacillus sp. DMB5]KUP23964.1 hydrolase [Paenibacillus sp. DMB5]